MGGKCVIIAHYELLWLCIVNNVYGIVSGKKWKRMNLTEFANHFNLSEMEKQAYIKVRNYTLWQ